MRVIAGEALGAKAVIDTHTPIVYQDWSLDAGSGRDACRCRAISRRSSTCSRARCGSATTRRRRRVVGDGQLALLDAGDAVRLRGAPGGGRLLLLAGVPLGEPVARYGPFVMNTEQEITTPFRDFQSGRMGEITRTAEVREG